METRLPCKRNVVFVGIFGDSGFVLSNDMRQPPAAMGTALHFFILFDAAALIGQPYSPRFIHHVSVSGCRAVTLWQPLIIRPFNWIVNNNNHVNVIRHHHKFRNRDIIIDFRDFFDAT